MSRTLYIVDGHSHIFRAYHAVGYLSTSKGVPSHAVLILSTMLWKLIREERPDYLGIALDPPAEGETPLPPGCSGAQANVVVLTRDTSIFNPLARLWIRVVSWMSYLR